MKIGFIGTESSKTFIDAFLAAQTFLPSEIIIHDQDKQKADSITTQYPGIFAARHRRELVQEATCFFTCLTSSEYPQALAEISPVARQSQVGIFHTDSLSVFELEQQLPCKIAKIIPQKNRPNTPQQYTYITGPRMTKQESLWFEQLLSTIGEPIC